MPWSSPFDEPISLTGGRELATLQQSANYIMYLPEQAQQQQRWQIAVANLINAAETGGDWLMFAQIAILQALNDECRGIYRLSASQTADRKTPISANCSPRQIWC